MATAKPRSRRKPRSRPGGRWLRVVAGLALLGGIALALGWGRLSAQARAGVAYGARVGCSCRYVDGRGLADCRKDFEDGMALVWLSEDATARSVTARVPLVASAKATFREGQGCVLERWRD